MVKLTCEKAEKPIKKTIICINLLKAMENAEKKVQAKVNDKKQKGTKVVSEKDW